jgi:hypothetical protein
MKHLLTFETFINENSDSENIFENEFKDLPKSAVIEFGKIIKLPSDQVPKLIKEISYNTIHKKFLVIGPKGMGQGYINALKSSVAENIDAVISFAKKKFPDVTLIYLRDGHNVYDIAAKKWLDAY